MSAQHAVIWPLPGDGEETQVRLFGTDEDAVTWAGDNCPTGGWQYAAVVDRAPVNDPPAYTEVQFNKLPRWAQDLVLRSQRDVEYHQARATAALEAARFIDPNDEHDYAIMPVGETAVRFLLTGDTRPYIEVRPEELDGRPGISVRCSDGTYVLPRAANVVFIGNDAP